MGWDGASSAPHNNIIGQDPQLRDPEHGDFHADAAPGYGALTIPDPLAVSLAQHDDATSSPAPLHARGGTLVVGGDILEDTVWDLTDVQVIDDVVVRNGATLTIAAGVTLTFQGYYGVLIRDGALVADGDPGAPITWTTDHPELYAPDDQTVGCWNGLTFLNVPTAAPRSWLKWNVFQYAKALAGQGLDDDTPRRGGRAPSGAGGALRLIGGDPVELTACVLQNNYAWRGGAMTTHYGAAPVLVNCLLQDNAGEIRAGAVFASYSRPSFIHATMIDNASLNPGIVVRTAGAVDSYHGAPTFTGCILWGNTTHHHNLYQILEPRVPDIQYCDLQAQQLGVGGLDHDPLLASTGVPWSNSPCIDAGDAAAASPWLPSTDLAGRARMVGRNPDMGCFEFDAVTSVPAVPSTLQIRAWPNPANPGVMVSWEQPATGPVRVTVHDLAGRKVITLVDETMPTGDRNRRWNGLDDRGRLVPSGTYHIRVTTAQSVEARTITLVR